MTDGKNCLKVTDISLTRVVSVDIPFSLYFPHQAGEAPVNGLAIGIPHVEKP